MKLEDGQFENLYTIAKEASDRTRSALYVFLIVNFGLFITVFGANIYNRPQERLLDFEESTDCDLFQNTNSFDNLLDCNTAKEDAREKGYFVDDNKIDDPKSAAVKKRIEALVAEEVASKKVQIPVVGFSFDIDYLWMLTCYFGPLAMIIVLATTQNETKITTRIASLLADKSDDKNLYRYVLLSSTQVLVAARPKASSHFWAEKIVYLSRNGFLRSIFMMPILTQVMIIYYDLGINDLFSCAFSLRSSCHAYYVDVISELRRHPFLESTQLAVELLSLVFMLSLAVQFLRITTAFREQYTMVANKIKCLDRH